MCVQEPELIESIRWRRTTSPTRQTLTRGNARSAGPGQQRQQQQWEQWTVSGAQEPSFLGPPPPAPAVRVSEGQGRASGRASAPAHCTVLARLNPFIGEGGGLPVQTMRPAAGHTATTKRGAGLVDPEELSALSPPMGSAQTEESATPVVRWKASVHHWPDRAVAEQLQRQSNLNEGAAEAVDLEELPTL
jgi:hypothetical protein